MTGSTGSTAPTGPTGPIRRRFQGRRRQDNILGWLFVLAPTLGFLAFVLYPLAAVIYYSFHSSNLLSGVTTYAGTKNYSQLLHDPATGSVAKATALFCVGLVVINISLAMLLAVLLNNKLRGTTVFRTLFFSPVVVSLVAWTITWNFLLQNNGGINAMLHTVGITGPNWLRGNNSALLSVVIVQVFKNVGLNMVLFLAALQGVPRSLLEAGAIDGAGPWRRFRSIVLPMISPTTLLTTIITISGSLQVFAQIQILTAGGPNDRTNVLVYFFYQQAFDNHDFGYGSAIAVVLFVIILVLTMIQWHLRKRWVFHES
ncbi:binding-protein-dependent transport systems inner membrane component [Catenulispora acidiphila DSM 44928]|uniref:Binding-protein-dependent transport systems inner membrane component n=1 Tax=Catenulispora acidiphila (strain DSM 44928 / JCM 14897 / NBRC 102108 / NRRL B-24433 / ID139908) TaxID=479433 RepID=C7Q3A9_CATAD|nr:binding-protein-dependent transport systems inner membrane component [Catenulispora acidiphila DSM 44928]